MIAPGRLQHTQRSPPRLDRLVRQPGNQVSVYRSNASLPNAIDIPQSDLLSMQAPGDCRLPINEGLDAKADPVDSALDHGLHELILNLPRSALKGDLCGFCNLKLSSNRSKQMSQQL